MSIQHHHPFARNASMNISTNCKLKKFSANYQEIPQKTINSFGESYSVICCSTLINLQIIGILWGILHFGGSRGRWQYLSNPYCFGNGTRFETKVTATEHPVHIQVIIFKLRIWMR